MDPTPESLIHEIVVEILKDAGVAVDLADLAASKLIHSTRLRILGVVDGANEPKTP